MNPPKCKSPGNRLNKGSNTAVFSLREYALFHDRHSMSCGSFINAKETVNKAPVATLPIYLRRGGVRE